MENMANNAERSSIDQKQTNPLNSPQTAHVHRDQNNYFGVQNDSTEKKGTYNKTKIANRLKELRETLVRLQKLDYNAGGDEFGASKKEVKGIIAKVYSGDPKDAEKRLIHKVLWAISNRTTEKEYQDWYLEDVKELITTIDIILKEMDLD